MSRRQKARFGNATNADFVGLRTTMTMEERDCERKGYRLTKTVLGSGAYAKVKLAYVVDSKLESDKKLADDLNEKGTTMVAIKIICKKKAPPEYLIKFFPREIDSLNATSRHHNVIQLYETFYTEAKLYLVMEYASKGDLLDFINGRSQHGIGIGEHLAKHFFRQLVEGVVHCHKRNVVHRDLKCENLLLDQGDVIKICDFGFATRYPTNKCKLLSTFCGSFAYAAPEILQSQKYDGKSADVWSMGVVLFAMVCGRLPFENKSLHTLLAQIKNKLTFPAESCCSQECRHMVRGLLHADSRRRFTTAQILNHPWFTNEKTTSKSSSSVPAYPTHALLRLGQGKSRKTPDKPRRRIVTPQAIPSLDHEDVPEEKCDFRMPAGKEGWPASPEPHTMVKFLHKRDPKLASKSPVPDSLRVDTPSTPGESTPCPRSFTPTPQPKSTRKELAVKVAQIVAETGHTTRPRDLNRETYAIMCKALQSPQRSAQTRTNIRDSKDGVWKYVTNMTSAGRRTATPVGAANLTASSPGQKTSPHLPPVKICFKSPVPHPPPAAKTRPNQPTAPWRRGLVISKPPHEIAKTGNEARSAGAPESARKSPRAEKDDEAKKDSSKLTKGLAPKARENSRTVRTTEHRFERHRTVPKRRPMVRNTLRSRETKPPMKRVHFSSKIRQH